MSSSCGCILPSLAASFAAQCTDVSRSSASEHEPVLHPHARYYLDPRQPPPELEEEVELELAEPAKPAPKSAEELLEEAEKDAGEQVSALPGVPRLPS